MSQPRAIAYWICTVVIALCIGSGGAAQALRVPQNVEGMTALGYPLHFIVLLGVWKVLGALTLLAPRLRLVKEWAYAGIFIDLSGAVVTASPTRGARSTSSRPSSSSASSPRPGRCARRAGDCASSRFFPAERVLGRAP